MIITLPWPPSVNNYWEIVKNWKTGRPIVKISSKGVAFRDMVLAKILDQHPEHARYHMLQATQFSERERLSVIMQAFPPDKRKRDLDNLLKATLDALQHAGIYPDDEQIDQVKVVRMQIEKPGSLLISVEAIT